MKQIRGYHEVANVTQKTSLLIRAVCDVCNKEEINAKINGDDEISIAGLLRFNFEKAAHASREERERILASILINIYELKDQFGKPLSLEKIQNISKEVFEQNGLR